MSKDADASYAHGVTTRLPRAAGILLVLLGASVVSLIITVALPGFLRDVLRIGCSFDGDGTWAAWTCGDGQPYLFIALQVAAVLWTLLVAGAVVIRSSGRRHDALATHRALRTGSRLVAATSGAVLLGFGVLLALQAGELARSCGAAAFSELPLESCSAGDVPVAHVVWSVMPVWAIVLIVEMAWASLIPARHRVPV